MANMQSIVALIAPAVLAGALAAAPPAAGQMTSSMSAAAQTLVVAKDKSVAFSLDYPVGEIVVAQPDTLQLVATTVAYTQPRLGGSVTFSAINVTLPVVSGLKPQQAPH